MLRGIGILIWIGGMLTCFNKKKQGRLESTLLSACRVLESTLLPTCSAFSPFVVSSILLLDMSAYAMEVRVPWFVFSRCDVQKPCRKRIRHGFFFSERGGDVQQAHPFLEFGVGVACHDFLG